MALFQSPIMTAASGSVGGLTFLPTPAGMALRARAIPVDPSTPFQSNIRAHFASLVSRWRSDLTPSQRAAWERYAASTPRKNALGVLTDVGGIGAWIRCLLPRTSIRLQSSSNAPTTFTAATFTPITDPVASAVAQELRFAFDNRDAWATQQFSAMLIYIAPPQNNTVRSYRRHYRYAGRIPGGALVPPKSPWHVATPFPIARHNRVFFRVAVTNVDNRLSDSQHAFAETF